MTTNPSHEIFGGVFPVFQTPFRDDDEIDPETLEIEIDWMFAQGIDGIVMAMVSEVLRLASDERDRLATLACQFGSSRGPVIISVGAESTKIAVRHACHAENVGAHAVMAIPPVSIATESDELLRYYESILNAIQIPIIVQDASGYVGKPMSLNVQASLFENFEGRVMYKPEAPPIGPRLSSLRELTGGRAHVFEGTGGIALVDSFQRGAKATMPGADLCWAIVSLWNALITNDWERINAINGPLASLISIQNSLDGFIAVEKYLLKRQGVFINTRVRGPVGYQLDRETRSEVDRLFELLKASV